MVDSAAPWWWGLVPLCKGYLGHHGVALRHLDDLIGNLREEEQAIVLVSGDLTANGGKAQLALSTEYLRSTIALTTSSRTGLNDSAILERTIPGNHDHWPGFSLLSPANPLPMLGAPTEAFFTLFWELPKEPYCPLASLRPSITFLGIDTDADVGPISCERLFAQGSFQSQLRALRLQIGGVARAPGEIRVLLLHHSFLDSSCMESGSRDELAQTLRECQISVILTGHTHDASTVVHSIDGWEVLEARCGTSTQRDRYPPEWTATSRARMPPLNANSVLVHRVHQASPNRLTWRTTPYIRNDQGFRVCNLGAAGYGEITV